MVMKDNESDNNPSNICDVSMFLSMFGRIVLTQSSKHLRTGRVPQSMVSNCQ